MKKETAVDEAPDAQSTENEMTRSIEDLGQDVFHDFDFNHPVFNERLNDVLDEQLRLCPISRSNVGTGYWWA